MTDIGRRAAHLSPMLLFATLFLLAPPLSAQVTSPVSLITPEPEAWNAPVSNVLLGGLLLGSLLSIQLEVGSALDEAIGHRSSGQGTLFRQAPRVFGSNVIQAGLAGTALLVGTITGDATSARVGLRTLETLALTGVLTVGLKAGIGRARPGMGRGENHFTPFTMTNTQWSFPSGHTSTAFGLATVLTLELGGSEPWIPYVAYPMATWVGAGRIMDVRHWPTDIIAGAALGILTAQLWHRTRRADSGRAGRLTPHITSIPDAGLGLGLRVATGNRSP